MMFLKKPLVTALLLTIVLFSCKKENVSQPIPAAGTMGNSINAANAASFSLNSTSTFMLGVNGHSLGVQAYTFFSPLEQVSMLKSMQMKCYRQDINFKSDGTISNLTLFTQLWTATTAAGITILPMIYTKTLDFGNTESQAYSAGKLLGSNVANKNAKFFNYYELGNELDNMIILQNKSGQSISDFDPAKFKIAAAYLKGMDDGIKSQQPGAKTMINASWLHYGFLKALENYGVKFNIVAYHWYSDMESAAANKSNHIPDISLELSSIFNKPIWFTEAGNRPKQVTNIEQIQSDFYNEFVTKCKNNPNVQAVLCYELCDEPKKNYPESDYGLVKWITPYSTWQYKIAARTFQTN